jgi:predicted nucleic acid-binding protein
LAIRTFLDANILIAAYRGVPSIRDPCLAILNDHNRFFIGSDFLYLETMPKAIYHRNRPEIEFYRTYFDHVHLWINDAASILAIARSEAEHCGLSAVDALHVATAHLAEAAVLYTLERGRGPKPIHRNSLVRVISIGYQEKSAVEIE